VKKPIEIGCLPGRFCCYTAVSALALVPLWFISLSGRRFRGEQSAARFDNSFGRQSRLRILRIADRACHSAVLCQQRFGGKLHIIALNRDTSSSSVCLYQRIHRFSAVRFSLV
jgi:hypothetical protein